MKNRSSQLNLFDLGAKFVSHTIDEMFDVVTELIDASLTTFQRSPVNRLRAATVASSARKVEPVKSSPAHTTH